MPSLFDDYYIPIESAGADDVGPSGLLQDHPRPKPRGFRLNSADIINKNYEPSDDVIRVSPEENREVAQFLAMSLTGNAVGGLAGRAIGATPQAQALSQAFGDKWRAYNAAYGPGVGSHAAHLGKMTGIVAAPTAATYGVAEQVFGPDEARKAAVNVGGGVFGGVMADHVQQLAGFYKRRRALIGR